MKIRLPTDEQIDSLKLEFFEFNVGELRAIALKYMPDLNPSWQLPEVEEFMQQFFIEQVRLKSFHDADYLAIWHRKQTDPSPIYIR